MATPPTRDRTRQAQIYTAEIVPPHPDRWPSHVLRGFGRSYYWAGAGPLSIKTFLGGAGARYRTAGATLAVQSDHYLVLNHGQHYEISIESETSPVESFCLFFRAGMAEEVWRSHSSRPETLLDEPFLRDFAPCHFYERLYRQDNLVSPILKDLRTELLRLPAQTVPDAGWLDERLRGVLEQLLAVHRQEAAAVVAFGKSASVLRAATRDELYRRLYRARDHIAACYDQPLMLEEIATVACLSPNHLLRTFAALFGQTPHQYLVACRLAEAQCLLTTTDLSVLEICLQVGFASLGSFSQLFARRCGVAPGEYRRRNRILPHFW